DPRQVNKLIILALFRRSLDGVDFFSSDDVFKVLVEAFDSEIGGRMLEPNHQQLVDETHRVVVTVKSGDQADRLIRIVADRVKMQVIGRNELITQQMFAN